MSCIALLLRLAGKDDNRLSDLLLDRITVQFVTDEDTLDNLIHRPYFLKLPLEMMYQEFEHRPILWAQANQLNLPALMAVLAQTTHLPVTQLSHPTILHPIEIGASLILVLTWLNFWRILRKLAISMLKTQLTLGSSLQERMFLSMSLTIQTCVLLVLSPIFSCLVKPLTASRVTNQLVELKVAGLQDLPV